MKAYKFLEEDYRAMYGDFQYTIGETYVHDGDIEICKAGFHASLEIRDAITYCSGAHLVEVELDGEIIEGEDKVAASKITILRELDIVRELEALASDKNSDIRRAVARNPNTPVKILETLASDKICGVRCSVAKNPNTPAKVLKTLAYDWDNDVRHAVAENPNTPVETLETLAGDKIWWVRCVVVENPNIPIEVLGILVDDEDFRVRRTASYNLDKRK